MWVETACALEALREYQKADSTTEIAVSADSLSNAMEALLRKMAAHDAETEDVLGLYFNRKYAKLDKAIKAYMS